MNDDTLKAFKWMFLIAALWNLAGAGLGYFNTAFTFQTFFGRELTDPLIHAIYQGAWGTTFVYFFGYLIVSHNPTRHPGIVIVGGIGKVGFLVELLRLYAAGLANPVVLVVVVGDSIFALAFLLYFLRLYKAGIPIL